MQLLLRGQQLACGSASPGEMAALSFPMSLWARRSVPPRVGELSFVNCCQTSSKICLDCLPNVRGLKLLSFSSWSGLARFLEPFLLF